MVSNGKKGKSARSAMMQKIVSCRVCGAVMVRLARDVCPECFRKEEELFAKVREFLAANPGITVPELAERVGTTVEQIEIFILTGRVERIGAQIAHQCQTCNKIIMTGLICHECLKSIKEHVSDLQAVKRRKDHGKGLPEAES